MRSLRTWRAERRLCCKPGDRVRSIWTGQTGTIKELDRGLFGDYRVEWDDGIVGRVFDADIRRIMGRRR